MVGRRSDESRRSIAEAHRRADGHGARVNAAEDQDQEEQEDQERREDREGGSIELSPEEDDFLSALAAEVEGEMDDLGDLT